MARSTYYYWLKRLKFQDKYECEKREVKAIFEESHGRYGYRRITAEMHRRGYPLNHKTIRKLMLMIGIKCLIRKKKYRSYKGEVGLVADNVLKRNFTASSPLCKLATDVTQIEIKGRKCFLSPVIDLFNGEILSYAVSFSPDLKLTKAMMDRLFESVRKFNDGAIMHSDQGWQYQHVYFRNILNEKGIIQSMSRKGNCLDNSVIESFFGIMKSELLYPNEFDSVENFIEELDKYIVWYNDKRIKLKLGGMSPVEYRKISNKSINNLSNF